MLHFCRYVDTKSISKGSLCRAAAGCVTSILAALRMCLQVMWTTKSITKDIFAVLMQRAPAGMDVEAARSALAQVRH